MSSPLEQQTQLLARVESLIEEAKTGDSERLKFFEAIRSFISLDQDNPVVHSFLYEFERKIIEFGELKLGSRINIDLFEDEAGKNLFHHIGINLNMLFEEIEDAVVPKDYFDQLLDMMEGFAMVVDDNGNLVRMNARLGAEFADDSVFVEGSPVSEVLPQFGTYLYKVALVEQAVEHEQVEVVLPHQKLICEMNMKLFSDKYGNNSMFIVVLKPTD